MKNWLLILLVFVVGCSKDDITPIVVTPPVVVTPPAAPTSTWSDDKTIEYEVVDPQLKSNGKGLLTVPVVIINYLPTSDGVNLDMNLASDGYYQLNHSTIEQCKTKIKKDKIVDKLEDDEDVQNVYTNLKPIDDEE